MRRVNRRRSKNHDRGAAIVDRSSVRKSERPSQLINRPPRCRMDARAGAAHLAGSSLPRKSAAIVTLKLRGALVTNTSDGSVRQPNLSVMLQKEKRSVAGARPIRNL
jgi:hypothetical protein